ncbi:MAG: hypothetical protein Q9227_000243 [Pyrenula ochraceoflavens]
MQRKAEATQITQQYESLRSAVMMSAFDMRLVMAQQSAIKEWGLSALNEGLLFIDDFIGDQVHWQTQAALEWLNTARPYVPVSNHAPSPGTCEWLDTDWSYVKWAGSSPAIFWVFGIPGCGKTVLANHVLRSFRVHSENTFAHFFSNSYRRCDQGNSFAANLISQLIQTKQIAMEEKGLAELRFLGTLKKVHYGPNECPLHILLGIMQRLLNLLSSFNIVVDALDECADDSLTQVISTLRSIASKAGAKVIAFSRERSDIRKIIGQGAKKITMNHTQLEADLLKFAENEIMIAPKLDQAKSRILQAISANANGSFLWTAFLLSSLRGAMNARDINDTLAQFPSQLADVYWTHFRISDARLNRKEKNLRRQIFLILARWSGKAPTTAEISDFVAINAFTNTISDEDILFDVHASLESACWPWLKIDHSTSTVDLIHGTIKDFMVHNLLGNGAMEAKEMSDLYLARKCLSILRQEKYRRAEFAARLLRNHLIGRQGALQDDPDTFETNTEEPRSYHYACLHFQHHLLALSEAPRDLLEQLGEFLKSNEFVSWSEILFELVSPKGIGAHVAVYRQLEEWRNKLGPEDSNLVPLEDYFVASYEALSSQLAKMQNDRVLPLLPLQRLGDFYNMRGQTPAEQEKSFGYREAVASGFEELLGPENPLTLRARTSFFVATIVRFRLKEAKAGLKDVAETQLRVLGERDLDYLTTREEYGATLYFMTHYEEAFHIWDQISKVLRDILGPNNPLFLFRRLEVGYTFEARGNLQDAIFIYDKALREWESIAGEDHPLSLYIQCAYGSALRKAGNMEQSQQMLFESWGGRQRLFKEGNRICLDSAIQLAVTFRESRQPVEAANVLDSISNSIVFETDFERTCQLRHLRSLLQLDNGQYAEPRQVLLDLVEKGSGDNREFNNRSLLWIRVDLSDILRAHGENVLASMLYADLVEAVEIDVPSRPTTASDNLDDEPDPARFLQAAEEALRLIREEQDMSACELLAKKGLRWKRPEDLWIFMGGPIADTARMTPPGKIPRESPQIEACDSDSISGQSSDSPIYRTDFVGSASSHTADVSQKELSPVGNKAAQVSDVTTTRIGEEQFEASTQGQQQFGTLKRITNWLPSQFWTNPNRR